MKGHMPKRGHEHGGIKGSKKGIKHGHAGRQLSETEHDSRMDYERPEHPAFPQGE